MMDSGGGRGGEEKGCCPPHLRVRVQCDECVDFAVEFGRKHFVPNRSGFGLAECIGSEMGQTSRMDQRMGHDQPLVDLGTQVGAGPGLCRG